MRATITFSIAFVLILTGAAVSPVMAELATQEEMEVVCQNWLSLSVHQRGDWGGVGDPRVVGVQDIVEGDTLLGRCFSIAPRGYVVVPALKELPPIKLYSDKSTLDVNQPGGLALLLRQILEHRSRLFIETYGSLEASQPRASEVLFGHANRQKWDRYLVDPGRFKADLEVADPRARTRVGPLMTTSWHQTYPYNYYCPNGDGGRTVVGCVATAAAQVMRYHGGPAAGIGNKTYYWDGDDSCDPGHSTGAKDLSVDFSDPYDWDNMPDDCPGGSCPTVERNALAELSYEVAVAFEMDFGVCGSGAFTYHAVTVMPTYFRYDAAIREEQRLYHTQATWFSLIQTEIDAGRPTLLSFRHTDPPPEWGHAVVCDGWEDTDGFKYHINYGWGGNHDGWFDEGDHLIPDANDPTNYSMIVDIKLTADCNGNGVSDPRDISGGTSNDYNDDGRPDECGVIGQCEIAELVDLDAGTSFGGSVHICADDPALAIVGAALEGGSGAAHVYRWTGSAWEEEDELTASDEAADDQFGCAVAINGDVAVVGARKAEYDVLPTDSGAAYVFRFNGASWVEEQILPAPDAEAGDNFGVAVAVDGDVIVVGADFDDCGAGDDCGAAYVYRYNGASWSLDLDPPDGKLVAYDQDEGDKFGASVAVSGDRIIVGAWFDKCYYGEPMCGSAYPYHFDGDSWNWQPKFAGDDNSMGGFGYQVAIDGDTAVVGAPLMDCDAGANCGEAHIYRFEVDSWVEAIHLTPTEPVENGFFGRSVSINGNIAVVPATGEDGGTFYAYHFDGNVWYLEGKATSAGTELGLSGSNSGGMALMGAAGGTVYAFALLGEVDCNRNAAVDLCDIAEGTSLDVAEENGIPDECEIMGMPGPAPYPDNRRRNRYISFDPNKAENDTTVVSFKITLVSLVLGSCDGAGTPDIEGWPCRDDDDCRACSTNENACWTSAIHCVPDSQSCDLTGATCVNDQAASIGQSWWVGAAHPITGVHLAVTEAHAVSQLGSVWSDTILVGDCEMVPYATYEVRTVFGGEESDPLKVSTADAPGTTNYWADCVGPLGNYCEGNYRACPAGNSDCPFCYSAVLGEGGSSLTPCTTDDDCPDLGEFCGTTCIEMWPPPDGFISFNDVSAAVFTFQQVPGLTVTAIPNIDIHGSSTGNAESDPPNYLVTFDDIGWMIKAYKGYPYPFSDSGDCPSTGAWP